MLLMCTRAAQYDTWLLIELTPKGVVFSFLFFSFLFFSAQVQHHRAVGSSLSTASNYDGVHAHTPAGLHAHTLPCFRCIS